jgi:hypothetical protein
VFFVLTAALFWASLCEDVWAASSAPAANEYAVAAEILPVMSSPGAEYVKGKTDDGREYIEVGDGIEGVVVYGNKLNLLPMTDAGLKKFADEWFVLPSPEDGSILGYAGSSGNQKSDRLCCPQQHSHEEEHVPRGAAEGNGRWKSWLKIAYHKLFQGFHDAILRWTL